MTDNDDFLKDDLPEEITEYKPLNIQTVKEKIPAYSSEKLCEMIVCDRYFGCYKEIAILCMEELANRRVAGNNFEFENYIEKAYNELPKLEIAIPDLGDVLRQIIGRKSRNR